MQVNSMAEVNREILNRCRAMNLTVDCGADGLFNAEVAIIAEAPGEQERIKKLPLVGASGKKYWDLVRPLGINRRSVYISNVVKRQLRQENDTKDKISKGELGQYAAILKWELEQLPQLKYIVCLGNYALEAVTGLQGIVHYRGSVLDTQINSISQGLQRNVTVIAMFNPAHVMREPKWEIMYKFDVARLGRVLDGSYMPHEISELINPSTNEALSFIERMHDERMPVALDIETIANETACIGLANDPHTGMCINFRDRSSNIFSLSDECTIRRAIQRLASDSSTRLVMQNGMFDSYWLWYKDRIKLGPSYFDTMLAHHTLYPTLPHNLGHLTSQYTEHPFYKDEGKSWREGGDIDTFWRYNVKDVCITLACQRRMLKELENQRLDQFFFSHVMRLQPHLIGMTVGGIKTDISLKKEIAEALAIELAALKEEFYRAVQHATGDSELRPNPASPKQMGELYFRRLRLVGRGVATDKKNRERMRNHPRTTEEAKRVLVLHDKVATEAKFFGTYAEMEIDEDGRCRSEYSQIGVQEAPGRLSSKGLMWGTGTNLQNQPQRAHKMFIADEGFMFSYFDLVQAEAQVVGRKAKIKKWNEQYALARAGSGYDAHRALAAEMFSIPYEEVPKEDWNADNTPTKRYIAKRCRHGLNYRMGPDRLAEVTGLSMREAEEAYRLYHRVTPELRDWWDAVTEEVRKNKCLYNAYGRRWILLERFDDDALKSIVAFYPQSTIGDKVSRCIYLCESDPDWPVGEARMALNIHDALIALHSENVTVAQAVQAIMKKHAEEPLYIDGEELIIPAELKASVPDDYGVHRWSTLKKIEVQHAPV